MSDKCPYCRRLLTVPPSITTIQQNHPSVTPNYTLNRSVARCKFCDQLAANKRAMDAECPPPSGKNPVKIIDEQIKEARLLIEEGVRREDLLRILPTMYRRQEELIKATDEGIKKAWDEYWAIWGKVDGPKYL
ncbi:hypothetical protein BP6252_09206 [Coleophoma cylindrospora]|uniref:Uncharacterized protein n=1 Tax=Coleophoma cylindrospora TaxID=1849047 RepID=A0A3D8R1I8_9HELO|nr:hypothetical protein BP6252_09206 [Coleophoma cylindrospora]